MSDSESASQTSESGHDSELVKVGEKYPLERVPTTNPQIPRDRRHDNFLVDVDFLGYTKHILQRRWHRHTNFPSSKQDLRDNKKPKTESLQTS